MNLFVFQRNSSRILLALTRFNLFTENEKERKKVYSVQFLLNNSLGNDHIYDHFFSKNVIAGSTHSIGL